MSGGNSAPPLVMATVTAVTSTAAKPVSVTIDGATTSSPAWSSVCACAVGDRVVLARVGSELYVVSKRQTDTGWVACPAASSTYTSTLSVRSINGLSRLTGRLSIASGSWSSAGTSNHVATLPSTAFSPIGEYRQSAFGYLQSSGAEAQCYIEIGAGSTTINVAYEGVGSFNTLYMDGLSWPNE